MACGAVTLRAAVPTCRALPVPAGHRRRCRACRWRFVAELTPSFVEGQTRASQKKIGLFLQHSCEICENSSQFSGKTDSFKYFGV